MFKKLFRPKWQHDNPVIRKEAILSLKTDDPALHQILAECAQTDDSLEVRQSAISQLTDSTLLRALCEDPDESIRDTAINRFADMLSGITGNMDNEQRQQAIDNCSQAMLFEIACRKTDNSVQEQALTLLTDQNYLVELLKISENSRTRQMAVAGIVDPQSLKSAITMLKNKDKRALQMAKGKLNALKEKSRSQQHLMEQQQTTCTQMEALAESSYQSQYAGKYNILQQQWQSLEGKQQGKQDKPLSERFRKAAALCLKTIELHQKEEELRLAEEEQHQLCKRIQEQICDDLEQNITQLNHSDDLNSTSVADFQETYSILKSNWQSQREKYRPHPKEQMRYDKASLLLDDYLIASNRLLTQLDSFNVIFEKITNRERKVQFKQLQDWLDKLTKKIQSVQWPEQLPYPANLQKLNELQQQLHAELEKLKSEQTQIKHNLQQQLNDLDSKLDNGSIDEAHSLLPRIRSNLDKLNSQEQKTFERQYFQLSKRLSEYDDWRQFATDPKREQLCEEMEKLVEIAIPIQQKSQAIKELQQEWKQLGDSRNTRHLWQRFKSAADNAYAPCKQYFEAQNQLRAHNYEQRKKICRELQQFIQQADWENADWKAAEKIYAVAKEEWRTFAPVDRAKIKGIQQEFNALLDQLNSKLRGQRQSNSAAKEALIQQAEALIECEDVQEAIDQAKGLQQKWQNIGITYRKDNQTLWKKFRKACDAVFERRNHERETAEHDREDNLRLALEICQRIRELASQPDDQLTQNQAQFKTLKNEYHQLGAVPKKHYENTKQQYHQLCEYFQQQFEGIAKRRQQQALQEIQRCAAICNRLENQLLSDTEKTGLKQQWQKPEVLPEAWWESINQRFELAINHDSTQDQTPSQHEDSLRLLCIRAEILADMKTPEEDQEQRMQYQMGRLSAGLGQDRTSHDKMHAAPDLQLEWCASPSISAENYEKLQDRFSKAMNAIDS